MVSFRRPQPLLCRLVSIGFIGLVSSCKADDLAQVFPELHACASIDDHDCQPPLALGAFLVAEETATQIVLRNRGTGIYRVDSIQVAAGSGVTLGDVPEAVAAHNTVLLPLMISPARGANRVGLTVVSGDSSIPNLQFDILFDGVAPLLEVCRADGPSETPIDCGSNLVVDTGIVRQTQALDLL